MANSNSFSHRDLLSPPSSSNWMPITKPIEASVSSTSPFDVDLAQKLEEFSVESSVSSPSASSSFSFPALPFSISRHFEIDTSMNLKENLWKEKESKIANENESYPKRNLGKKMEDIEKEQLTGQKCFPPPISCLRKLKVGKPYKYLTYDKESESYVIEEIKIPNGSLFHASREDGRLKLYMNLPDEEESEEN